jgi:hypothetical protein
MIRRVQWKPRSTDHADSVNDLAGKTEKTNEELTAGTRDLERCTPSTAHDFSAAKTYSLSVGSAQRQEHGELNH